MTLQKALFILRHGSAEGVKAYLEAVKVCEDEINRQKAEIERLNKEVDRLSQCVLYHDGQIADAIIEFAERLKNRFTEKLGDKKESFFSYSVQREIDNLVKEMTEDQK